MNKATTHSPHSATLSPYSLVSTITAYEIKIQQILPVVKPNKTQSVNNPNNKEYCARKCVYLPFEYKNE